jgi:hypothetical protein
VGSDPLNIQHYTGFRFKEGIFGTTSVADTTTGYFLGNEVNEYGWFAINQLG